MDNNEHQRPDPDQRIQAMQNPDLTEEDEQAQGPDHSLDRGLGQIDLSQPPPPLKRVVEGALMAAGRPLSPEQILELYPESQRPHPQELKACLQDLSAELRDRGIELVQVAGGWRMQVTREVAPWVGRLWQEKPPRYSRALLETLALIAYRQPITRGEIEDIRGVAVSTHIIKTLSERDWIRVIGHRDVPGRPALYATTRQFLEHFGLRSLNELPPLSEIRDPAFFDQFLPLEAGGVAPATQVEMPLQPDPVTDNATNQPAESAPNQDQAITQTPVASSATPQDDTDAKRLQ